MRFVVLLVASGCSFSTTTNPAGGDDVAPGDGGIDSSRVQPPEDKCGKAGAISDNFADDTPSQIWTVRGASGIVESGGTLAVTPMVAEFSGYQAQTYVDLRDASAEVEIRSMVTAASGAIAFFRFTNGTGLFGISISNDMISMGVAPSPIVTVPYDPVAHRHLRVSHAGSTLAFSTSPDGLAWTERHTAPAPAFVGAVSIGLGATNPNGSASPGTVTYADFNTYVAPAKWCAAATLVDAFDDAVIGPQWAHHGHSSTGCIEYENLSAARADQNGTVACDAYFGTSAMYRLKDSAMVIRVPAITTFTTGWITYLGAWDLPDEKFARMYFEQNQLCADGTSVPKTCVAYSTTRDLWRIREAAGMIYFEAGSGTTYTLVHSQPTPFPMDAIRPYFGTFTDRAIQQNIGLNIDRFN